MRPLRTGIVLLVMLALLAGTARASSQPAELPAAGEWYGSAWTTCTEAVQGLERLRFTFGADGRWTAVIGPRRAEGTTRIEGRYVVIEGAVVGQPLVPVYYRLMRASDGTLYGLTMLSAPSGKGAFPALVELRPGRSSGESSAPPKY